MGKIILFNMLTLDGFFESAGNAIDWHNADKEFNEFAIRQLAGAAALVFGRRTYELMAGYWPTPQARTDDPAVAEIMNVIPKVVFSRTLEKVDWKNSRLAGDPAQEIQSLRNRGKDVFIFGSAILASHLRRLRLIDEYRVMINPVALGSGIPLFKPTDERLDFRLAGMQSFRSGNVLLTYRPVQGDRK